MGVDTRRPPLPAPTDTTSMDDTSPVATEVATNVTARTDKTSYTIPEDGSPIVISTHKKEGRIGLHGRSKSQTSLLIEYFEGSKTGDKTKGRPSVRVKVTPSSRKSSSNRANDAVQITSIGSDRKPSYTRRISLSSKNVETGAATTELSHSSGSNLSGPPVEIEVLHNGSDLSNPRSSRGLLIAHNDSNVSSMPPDSMLEGETDRAYDHSIEDEDTVTKESFLAAPQRRRSRSTSRERITQRVMEKLGHSPAKQHKSSAYESSERQRRSSSKHDDNFVSGAESSLVSNPVSSQRSYQSNASRVTNNARLLEKVEDTIKRILLPEITAIRDDQRAERKLRTFDSTRRGSDYEHSLERRISKSSSSPNIKSKPKVVLNRDGDDPGTVLSRGDSEYRKTRKSSGEHSSSRRSSGHRKSESHDDERVRRRSSEGKDLGRLAAAGIAGGALTAAALKHHDSEQDLQHRRKRRSKSRSSRSRSNSIAEGAEEAYTRKDAIPPMPMASHINDSDLTRASLLSDSNDQHDERSMHIEDTRTPVREVSRGSVDTAMSPVSSRTPTRTPISKGLGMSHNNHSIESPSSVKGRTAALAAAAGAGAIALNERHAEADGYGRGSPKRGSQSPAQSVSSLRMQYEDPLMPAGLRPRSTASRTSAERLHKKAAINSATSSPTARPLPSRELTEEFVTPMESRKQLARERSQTPSGEDVDEWFDREHLQNEQYRKSLDAATNRTSYQTNPYPEDEKRFESLQRGSHDFAQRNADKDIHGLGANPEFVHTPVAVESAVASLVEPSTLSSTRPLSIDSPTKATYSDRMAEQLRNNSKEGTAMYEGSTLSQTMPSDDRWAALKRQAHSLSSASSTNVDATGSPRQSPAKSVQAESPVKMVSSSLPLAHDPLPEIGYVDDTRSEVSTNPSIIKGPLGGDVTGQSTWPYTPSPRLADNKSREAGSGYSKDALLAGAVSAGAGIVAARRAHVPETYLNERDMKSAAEDLYENFNKDLKTGHATPTPESPALLRDEGYVTDAGMRTPKAEQQYSRGDVKEYHQAMDDAVSDEKDPFVADSKHARHFSGNSHGMASPLYDSATGKGMDNIQSKDIVALMDHLTVRDAQRNARDTEILITLVRHATEMRQNFEDMKRFIHEQDKLIMSNAERGQEATVQKVLSGPRPIPTGSPRTPRKQSEEDIQTKRKGILRRALRGLTSSKNSGDLTNIESMLVQVLDNVEQLKHQGVAPRDTASSYIDDGMDSYERLRAAPDPGYEADGAAGTDSTPSQSGHFAGPYRNDKQVFHSGYNGRPGSENRVSTVVEGDEDEDLEPHEHNVLQHQFENNERMLTPTQDFRPDLATSPTGLGSPVQKQYAVNSDMTPRAIEKQQKHKSNNSSIFGVPKMSRWSKTTTSSAVPESPVVNKNTRPLSAASRSGSSLQHYDDDDYSLQEDDRLRSTQSLAREHDRVETKSMRSQASRLTRTPSPLIPSEISYREQDRDHSPIQHDDYASTRDIDDPKYHAQRNSILLQHPQPRQGSTNRHQNNLESKAHSYDETLTESDISQRSGSDFDPAQWGSTGVGALNKNRFSQAEPLSPVSMNSPYNRTKDNGPLVPSQVRPTHVEDDDYDDDEDDDDDDEELYEPQYSNSGFARDPRAYYSSPLGSGHLLEPIPEVRYSLETDGHVSPEPQIASARAVTARKITGPRPMGRSTSATQPKELETSGTVRRKPVPGSRASHDTLSSQESETF